MALRDPRYDHDAYEPTRDAPSRPQLEVITGSERGDLVPERPLGAARGVLVGIGLSVLLVWLPLGALVVRWLR